MVTSTEKVNLIVEEVYADLGGSEDAVSKEYCDGINDFRNMLLTLLNVEETAGQVTKKCKCCNKPFTITKNEIDWLAERDLAPFQRCKACRQKRKIKKETQNG